MLLFLGNLQTPRFFQLPTDFCFFVLTVKVKKRILFTLIFCHKDMDREIHVVNKETAKMERKGTEESGMKTDQAICEDVI